MKATLKIQNVKCNGCANTIINKITKINEVSSVFVSVEDNTLSFDYKNEEQIDQVKSTLKKLGYPEAGEENSIGEKAKSYLSCAIGKL
ncbi:heavy metal-associated domain-containing protein [Flavobacterium filum]|uniref:heavy-metal-associated domain-containing protein n=1 Tax=Flavobacterium filum TaxID=370974 RepID=UPI0023F3484B|nr:heavy metal-associated domain-containing protein [Flavobacterium filum]